MRFGALGIADDKTNPSYLEIDNAGSKAEESFEAKQGGVIFPKNSSAANAIGGVYVNEIAGLGAAQGVLKIATKNLGLLECLRG
jgi:hypothetical protein